MWHAPWTKAQNLIEAEKLVGGSFSRVPFRSEGIDERVVLYCLRPITKLDIKTYLISCSKIGYFSARTPFRLSLIDVYYRLRE